MFALHKFSVMGMVCFFFIFCPICIFSFSVRESCVGVGEGGGGVTTTDFCCLLLGIYVCFIDDNHLSASIFCDPSSNGCGWDFWIGSNRWDEVFRVHYLRRDICDYLNYLLL